MRPTKSADLRSSVLEETVLWEFDCLLQTALSESDRFKVKSPNRLSARISLPQAERGGTKAARKREKISCTCIMLHFGANASRWFSSGPL